MYCVTVATLKVKPSRHLVWKKINWTTIMLADELSDMASEASLAFAERDPVGELHSAANYTPLRNAENNFHATKANRSHTKPTNKSKPIAWPLTGRLKPKVPWSTVGSQNISTSRNAAMDRPLLFGSLIMVGLIAEDRLILRAATSCQFLIDVASSLQPFAEGLLH